jgi:hypothetical protein
MHLLEKAILGITALMAVSLFLPAANVPEHVSSLRVEYRQKLVIETLTTFAFGRYLLLIPALSFLLAPILLSGFPSRRSTAIIAGLGFILIVFPSTSFPGMWLGAISHWHLRLVLWSMFTGLDTQFLYGYYSYISLLYILASAYLILSVASTPFIRVCRHSSQLQATEKSL